MKTKLLNPEHQLSRTEAAHVGDIALAVLDIYWERAK
jgi:hypothetical protein